MVGDRAASGPEGNGADAARRVDVYTRDVIPIKAPSTQQANLVQIGLLLEFFGDDAPLDGIEPMHVKQYMHWHSRKAIEWYESKKRQVPPKGGLEGTTVIRVFVERALCGDTAHSIVREIRRLRTCRRTRKKAGNSPGPKGSDHSVGRVRTREISDIDRTRPMHVGRPTSPDR